VTHIQKKNKSITQEDVMSTGRSVGDGEMAKKQKGIPITNYESIRRLLRRKLSSRGYQRQDISSTDQALAQLQSNPNAIIALVCKLEAKDRYTSGHSRRVAEISVAVARELGIPRDTIEKIRLGGWVHGVGKIGVRESILNKKGRLTESEYRQITFYPEVGERVLAPILKDEEILKIVRHHHERYDGGGYPDGLSGAQTSLGARILQVSDAFDAMTSERPYRDAINTDSAFAEIDRCKGAQFDPEVAGAFLRIREFIYEVVGIARPGTYGTPTLAGV